MINFVSLLLRQLLSEVLAFNIIENPVENCDILENVMAVMKWFTLNIFLLRH